jgi:hypothetical protein
LACLLADLHGYANIMRDDDILGANLFSILDLPDQFRHVIF